MDQDFSSQHFNSHSQKTFVILEEASGNAVMALTIV